MAGRVSFLTGALIVGLTAGFDWPTRTERLLDQLDEHSDAAARADLVRLLTGLRNTRAREALLILARDAQPSVRAEALRGLATQDSVPTEPFTEALTDEDAGVRAEAAAALGRLRASDAAAGLIRLLGDTDTAVRVAAARALGRLREVQAAAALAAALEDATLEVRVAAALALADLGEHEAFDVLLAKLRDPTPELRIAVVEALPQIDAARAQAALREALFDASDAVVIAALRALNAVPLPYAPDLEARLQHLTRHRQERVAQAARVARSRAASSPPAPPERAWLAALERSAEVPPDQEGALVRELEASLPAGEALAVDPLRLWLARAQAPYRGRIAELIARARPSSAAELLRLAADRDPEVRRAIVVALGKSGDARAADTLVERLADREPSVADAAARALAQVVEPPALDTLAGQLRSLEPGDPQRVRAARALADALERLGHALDAQRQQMCRELLRDLVGGREPALAALAARGLGGLPGTSDALLRAASDRPVEIRVAALRASIADASEAAQQVRRAAASDPDPRVVTTAWIAQWRAGDRLDAERLREQLQGAAWPLGPVAAFLLASLEPDAFGALGCATLAAREPLTRANALAGLARGERPDCPNLSKTPFWLERSSVWPLRMAAARWLSRDQTESHQAALASCTHHDPHALVRAACSPANAERELAHCSMTSACPLPLPGPAETRLSRAPAGSYRALVLADGRALVSVADAAGEVRWPGLLHLAEENPWQWAYGQE